MKKLILLLAVVFTVSVGFAQEAAKKGKASVEQRAQRSVDKLDKAVTLTADQKTQVYDLSLTRAKKVDEIRAKYKGQPEKKEDAKTEIKAAHKEYKLATKALLTPEQVEALKAKHEAKKGDRKSMKKEESAKSQIVEDMIPVED